MKSSQIGHSSFVDPSSLSLPSPPSEAPSPSSPVIDPSLASSRFSGSYDPSSRKRARTDATPEEKREARAHRNRIAAQNSRDRRKQQFNELENKVRILQQENDQLRAQLQLEKERRDETVKDTENAELRERLKSLEQGWESVLRALQAHGLPSTLFPNPPSKVETPSSVPSPNEATPSQQPPTTTFPVFINPSPVLLPLSPLSDSDLPAVLHRNLDEPTRHLARVATAAPRAVSLQRSQDGAYEDINETSKEDSGIETWFNEVLTPNENLSSISDTTSTVCGPSPCPDETKTPATEDVMGFESIPGLIGGSGEDADMNLLLNILPASKDEFQALFSSVINEEKAEGPVSEEAWTWDFAQPSLVNV